MYMQIGESRATVRNDPVLYGECLGGALYWNDFLQLARRHGFVDPRLVTDKPILITNPELALRIGDLNFFLLLIGYLN